MSITVQKPTFDARIAGQVVRNLLHVSTSAGEEQINSESTIWAVTRPSFADEGQTVTIWAKNDDQGQIFGGEIVGFDWTYPGRVGIMCRDMLARTRETWGGEDEEYAAQTSAAVVRNVLEKNAIPSSVASIEGDDWTVGVVDPVVLKNGDDGYSSIIQPLDDAEGYRTYSLTTGVIVRRLIGAGGASSSMTFERGVEILADAKRTRTRDGIVNRVIMTGLEYEGLLIGGPGVGEASAANPYVVNVSGYNTERVQSNLIEDDATALLFAQRRLAYKNRRPERVEFSIPMNPRVQVGMLGTVIHPELELGSASGRIIYVGHEGPEGGAKTTIRILGGALAGVALLPPVAVFDVQTILEGLDTGSGVTPLIVLVCDGAQSYDPDGTIASYAWTITPTGGTATPSSGTGVVLRSVLTGATTSFVVNLTVTDNDGQTGELELTTPVNLGTMPVEDLYLAFGDIECSDDGEQTWRTYTPASGDATCLMPFAPEWGQVWGTSTGHIYATFDKLQTAPIDFGAPHGAVACTAVWVHEVDQTRLWAGFSDGQVWYGVVDTAAFTCSFTLAGTVPDAPIVEVRESYGALGELRATAGAGYYYSGDGGASWSLQYTFDVAWRMAAGFDTNLASGLNSTPPLYDEDGAPPTVSATHIRGLSFGWREQELYAADDAAGLYLGAGPTFNLTAHADTTPAQVNHMIRSGNIDRVVYLAVGDGTGVNNGFVKWIPDVAAPFYIRKTIAAQGYMIGYGALHANSPGRFQLLLLPSAASGTEDKLFYYALAWQSLTPPAASYYWQWAAINPQNPLEWLLLGNSGISGNAAYYSAVGGLVKTQNGTHSPVWHTLDGGLIWTQVNLTSPVADTGTSAALAMTGVEWSLDGTSWAASRLDITQGTTATIWRGTGSTAAAPVTDTTTTQAQRLVAGLNGDWYFAPAANNGTAHKASYFDAADSFHVPTGASLGTSDGYNISYPDRMGSAVLGATNASDLYGTTNYRTAQPTFIVAVAGTSSAVVGANVYVGSRTTGVLQISDPFGAATPAVVHGAAWTVGTIRADKLTHSHAAVRVNDGTGVGGSIGVFDGITWRTVPLPTDSNPITLADFVEIAVS